MGSIAVFELTTAGTYEDARDAAMTHAVQNAKRKNGMQYAGNLLRTKLSGGGANGWARAFLQTLHEIINPPSGATPTYMVCFEYYDNSNVRQSPILQQIPIANSQPRYAISTFALFTVSNGPPVSVQQDGQLSLHIEKDQSNAKLHQMTIMVPERGNATNWAYLDDMVVELPYPNATVNNPPSPQNIANQNYLLSRLSFSRCL